ncbi:low temperature requirement protein A [Micromonospora sp. CA-240977]|uniref:low temperature requirement protein A n=1 Tax=Micromonospora sp. CA-240977 TaxID=3239957 RepID=UPI003D8A2BDB
MQTRPGFLRGLGDSRSPDSATVLELLFDIVYVFALARLAGRVADDLTIVRHTLLSEAGQTVLFFTAMWMIWSLNALLASTYDPRRPDLQAVLLATMFGTLVLAVSLPEAFGKRGVVFSCTYVLIQIGRPLFLTFALRGHPGRAFAARVLTWHTASGVLWISGGISGGLGRGVFWTLALAIELIGAATAWPVPSFRPGWFGRTGADISHVHLAERYNQFFMIALAEVVLEAGAAVSFPGFTREGTITLVAAFVTAVSFWRIYFYHVRSGQAATPGGQGIELSRWASYSLLIIVGGIICTAVGFGQVIEDPHSPIDWALVVIMFGGPVLFLVGRSFLERESRSAPRCRMLYVGAAVLVVAALPMVLLPPVAVAATAAVILAAIAVFDQRAHRRGSETNPTL